MKKLFLIGLVLLLSLSMVYGYTIPPDDAVAGYTFNNADNNGDGNPLDVAGINNNASNQGATTGTTGQFNEAFDFEESNTDYVDLENNSIIPWGTNTFTFCGWVKFETVTGSNKAIFASQQNGGSGGLTFFYVPASGVMRFNKLGGAGTYLDYSVTPSTVNFEHWCAKGNSSGMYIYKDGSQVSSDPNTGNFDNTGTTRLLIGARPLADVSTDFFMDGIIDDVYFYHRSLHDSEISDLYTNGEPYASETTPDDTLTITAKDADNSTSINTFNATIAGNATVFTTTNGTIYINITESGGNLSLQNVTVLADTYFTNTYTNWNISLALVANLTQYSKVTVLSEGNETLTFNASFGTITSNGNAYGDDNYNNTYHYQDVTEIYYPYNSSSVRILSHAPNHFFQNKTYDLSNSHDVVINLTKYPFINATDGWNLSQIQNIQVQTPYGWFNGTGSKTYIPYNSTIAFNVTAPYYKKYNLSFNFAGADNYSTELWYNDTQYIKVYVRNYLNTSNIASVLTRDYDYNVTEYNNPIFIDAQNHFYGNNYTTIEKIFYVEDRNFQNVNETHTFNITRGVSEQYLVLEPYKLMFTFWQDGVLNLTEGVIHDQSASPDNSTYGFQNTSFVILQQELSEGYIKAKFGMQSGLNWTQYYEYINDYTTNIDEDIEILQLADWGAYIRVLEYSNSPIKDAVIRAEYAYTEIGNWTSYNLLGQRLTNDEGYTFFIADSRTEVLFTISKDGYEPLEALITIGDESFSKDEALTFYLQRSSTGSKGNAWFYIQRDFSNRSLDLTGMITAKGRESVTINTDYRVSYGLPVKDLTPDCDGFMRCSFTLVSDTDFKLSSTDDIIVYIYLDNELWRTVTIHYDSSDKNRIFNFSGLNETYLNIMLIVFILISTLAIGMLFQNTGVGIGTFYVTSFLAGIISTSFLWITLVLTLFFMFTITRRIMSE